MIFITEYMSSGSLKQFLKKTKKNHKTMNEKVYSRKTWCLDDLGLNGVRGAQCALMFTFGLIRKRLEPCLVSFRSQLEVL